MLNIYRRFSINIVRGSGVYIYDDKNREYLDFTSGIATVNFGHCNQYIKDKLSSQLDNLWHCSNLFNIKIQENTAERLIDLTFANKIFFCSSGLEAVESGIKFIRRYFYSKGSKKYRIITFKNGFHGRSIAGISAGGGKNAKEGYRPLLEGFDQIEVGDIKELNSAIQDNTAAILLETIQSEGGVYKVNEDYIRQLREICDRNDILLCFDEVQTGFGRTGKLFHYQKIDVEPDILMSAKGMGNGFPVAACLVRKKIADAILPGTHGSTYAGNPLAVTVVNAVLDIITEKDFLSNVRKNAEYLWMELLNFANHFNDIIKEIRGDGFLIGIEFLLNSYAENFLSNCIKLGLLITRTSNQNTLRILPPLIIERKDIDHAIDIFNQAMKLCRS